MEEFYKKLGEAVENALNLKGTSIYLKGKETIHMDDLSEKEDYELGISLNYFDENMAVHILAEMLKEGTLTFNVDKDNKDYKYIKKLLKIKE